MRDASSGILYPYQQRWIDDGSRFKIGMFARQTGKTFTTTLEIVLDCLAAAAVGRTTRWVILSRGERQAREAMEEGIKRHFKAIDKAVEITESSFLGGGRTEFKALEVIHQGSRITALPANPDTARGFSANVFLDEFAFHQDSRAIWKALFPVISKNGLKLRITSTPNGKNNKFYELMSGKDGDGWSRHAVTIHQAVADGLPRDVEGLRTALGDADAWAQEFELEWLDESSAWLSYDLIASVEDADAGDPGAYQGGPCFVGVDIAARNDLFVIWVWEQVGDVFWTREIVEAKRVSFARQDELLDQVMRRYAVVRVAMDQTGMGEKPVEDARRRHGAYVVEGVLFTGPRKLIIATCAKQAFEDRRARIPAGNPVLRADLHKLKKITGETGAPRLIAERDGDGHADRAWAAFLGLAAGAGGGQPSAGATVEPRPDSLRPAGAKPAALGGLPILRRGIGAMFGRKA